MLEVGSDAPEFNLPNHRGDLVSLQALKGRKVLVWFYPVADTPG